MNNPDDFDTNATHASGMPTGTMPHSGGADGAAADGPLQRAKEVASGAVQSTVEAARSEAEQAKWKAEQKAREVSGRAKSAASGMVDERKRQISGQLGMVSDALNRTSAKLHEDQHGSIAQYTDLAAEKVESLRQTIENKDLGDLVDDIQGFTRRQPALVFGGLFLAGLAAMRFMKASSQQRTERELERVSGVPAVPRRYGKTLSPQQASVVARHQEHPRSLYNEKS